MTVHSALGNGFQEVIYQRALEIEMTLEKIPFSTPKLAQAFQLRHVQQRDLCPSCLQSSPYLLPV